MLLRFHSLRHFIYFHASLFSYRRYFMTELQPLPWHFHAYCFLAFSIYVSQFIAVFLDYIELASTEAHYFLQVPPFHYAYFHYIDICRAIFLDFIYISHTEFRGLHCFMRALIRMNTFTGTHVVSPIHWNAKYMFTSIFRCRSWYYARMPDTRSRYFHRLIFHYFI